MDQPQICIGEIRFYAHLCGCSGLRTVLIIIIERVRQRYIFLVDMPMIRMGFPFPVRCLVVAHQKERTRTVTFTQPLQRFVGDYVSDVAFCLNLFFHFYHLRVEIFTLTRKNGPEVKTGWLVCLSFPQMPLADDGCLISTGLQMFGYIWQGVVQRRVQCRDAVHVIIGACENGSAAWRANGVCHIAMIQTHAFIRKAINVRRGVYACAISAYCLRGMIVCHDENDIGPVGLHVLTTAKFET